MFAGLLLMGVLAPLRVDGLAAAEVAARRSAY
jgi:hypothetical protein